MKITKISLKRVNDGESGMVALVDLIVDGDLALSDLRLIRKGDRLQLVWPVSQFSSTSRVRHISNPINRAAQEYFEQEVIEAYKKEVKRL